MTTTTQPDPLTHARSQATAQVASIVELYDARERLGTEDDNGDTIDMVEADGCAYIDIETIEATARDCALEVLVRGDWTSIGSQEDMSAPHEYLILLCTGGPAVRLRGTLSAYAEPEVVHVECQDWGTPWTMTYHLDAQCALLWFAGLFYYGEA